MDRRLLYAAIAIIIAGAIYTTSFLPLSELGGNLGTAFTIHYVDNTTKEVDPFTNPLAVIFNKLSVTDSSGKAIEYISWSTYVKATWKGTPSTFRVSGECKLSVNDANKQTIPVSVATLKQNTIEPLTGGQITAGTLEGWAGAATSATLKIATTVNVEITFIDGTTKNGGATGTGIFKYLISSDSEITSVSIATYLGPVEDGRVFPIGEN